MKFFVILILISGLAAGGWYAYDKGYLDDLIGGKETENTGEGEKAKPNEKAIGSKPNSTQPKKVVTAPKTTSPKPAPASKPDPSAPKTKLDLEIEKRYPMPEFVPLEKIVKNWTEVPERAFPSAITVNVPVKYTLVVDGKEVGNSEVEAGTKAIPLKFRPGQVLITNQPNGTMKAVVNVDDTDFKQRIQAEYNSKVEEYKQGIYSARKVAKQLASRPQQEGDPEMTAAGWHNSTDPRFAPVKAYLAAGKLESGILEEAKHWKWLGTERHEGATYDAVLVQFEVDTIFGIFPNSMKALLRNGQVVKWIDADTGEERT